MTEQPVEGAEQVGIERVHEEHARTHPVAGSDAAAPFVEVPRVEVEVIEPERRPESGDVAHADGEGHAENQREYPRGREQLAQAGRRPARGRRGPRAHRA